MQCEYRIKTVLCLIMKTGQIYQRDICKGRFIIRVGIIPFMYASHNVPHITLPTSHKCLYTSLSIYFSDIVH